MEEFFRSSLFWWVSTLFFFWVGLFLCWASFTAFRARRVVLGALLFTLTLVVLSGVLIHWWIDWLV